MMRRAFVVLIALVAISSLTIHAGSVPTRAKLGMVITQSDIASEVGFDVIKNGGNAIDAAVATGFAMAVTHPTAGNIGGGGFMVVRTPAGDVTTFDYRERAPLKSVKTMYLGQDGEIVLADDPAVRLHVLGDPVGDPPSVEGVGPVGRDRAQRASQFAEDDPISLSPLAAAWFPVRGN